MIKAIQYACIRKYKKKKPKPEIRTPKERTDSGKMKSGIQCSIGKVIQGTVNVYIGGEAHGESTFLWYSWRCKKDFLKVSIIGTCSAKWLSLSLKTFFREPWHFLFLALFMAPMHRNNTYPLCNFSPFLYLYFTNMLEEIIPL